MPQKVIPKMGEILKTTKPSSGSRCENCGYRPRWRCGNEIRKWCARCIRVWKRKQELTESIAEKAICKIVEPLYLDAQMSGLPIGLQSKLEKAEFGHDIFFYGPIGTGKTYAMAALVRKYVYEGYECERINFDDFCVKVRSAMSPASTLTEWDMIEPMKNIDILFIDDLGLRSKQETDFAYVTFYSILNKRQERRLSTIISSNKDIKRLATAFDSRIASRLSTALIIEISGKDRRAAIPVSTPKQPQAPTDKGIKPQKPITGTPSKARTAPTPVHTPPKGEIVAPTQQGGPQTGDMEA